MKERRKGDAAKGQFRPAWPDLAMLGLGLLLAFGLPAKCGLSTQISGAIYASLCLLALSLAMVWGAGGILCLGQGAFFGLGGYAYAMTGINIDNAFISLASAILIPALFAALLGYFIFWGRVSSAYLGVMTLTVTLILERFISQTGGDQWTIGTAALGGFNGVPATPVLSWPWGTHQTLTPGSIFTLSVIVLFAAYFGCKALLASRFGRVLLGCRENETRAHLLGHNVRLYKEAVFVLGGGLAGLAGALFANSVFVSPTMFSLGISAQVIIWVIVGGLGTLAGPLVGCIIVQALRSWLGTLGQVPALHWLDPNLVLGIVLVLSVRFMPRGLAPLLGDGAALLRRIVARRRSGARMSERVA